MIASTPMWFYIDVHDKDYCFFYCATGIWYLSIECCIDNTKVNLNVLVLFVQCTICIFADPWLFHSGWDRSGSDHNVYSVFCRAVSQCLLASVEVRSFPWTVKVMYSDTHKKTVSRLCVMRLPSTNAFANA